MVDAGMPVMPSAHCGGVVGYGRRPFVEADAVFGHEVLVVQAVLDEHVGHGQHERQVGAGVDGHPLVGKRDGVVAARVHQHDVGAVLASALQVVHRAGTDGVGVAAPDEHGHLAVRNVACVIARADGLREPAVLRQVARSAVRVHVRAAQRVHEALRVVAAGGSRILHHGKRLGAVGGDDGLHLLGDLAVGLLPADGFELSLVVFLERVGQAVFGIGDGRIAVPAGAQGALAIRVIDVADHLGQPAVLHISREAALGRAGVAQRMRRGHFPSPSSGGMRLLPSAEAHVASRRREPNCSGAASQEAAPGDSVF